MTDSADEPGAGTLSLQEQLQSLQEAVQAATEAWSIVTPAVDATGDPTEGASQHSGSKEEADRLLQRAEAAEQVCA